MDLSADVVDEATADIVLAFDLDGHDAVLLWWRVMSEAWQAAGADVDGLVAQVQTAARDLSFPEQTIDVFVQAVASGGIDVVERLLALEPWMPALYQSLRDPAGGESTEEWGWLTAPQRDAVYGYWGDQWPAGLGAWLAERWGPGWEQHPVEHRVAWLDDLLTELDAAGPSAAPEQAVPAFTWVTAAQADTLAGIWGADWAGPLREQLDSRWGPDWDANPDAHKTAWLDALLAEWLPQARTEPVGPGQPLAGEPSASLPEQAAEQPPAEQAPVADVETPQQSPEQQPSGAAAQASPEVATLAAERGAAVSEAIEEIRQLGVTEDELTDEQITEMLDTAVLEQLNSN